MIYKLIEACEDIINLMQIILLILNNIQYFFLNKFFVLLQIYVVKILN